MNDVSSVPFEVKGIITNDNMNDPYFQPEGWTEYSDRPFPMRSPGNYGEQHCRDYTTNYIFGKTKNLEIPPPPPEIEPIEEEKNFLDHLFGAIGFVMDIGREPYVERPDTEDCAFTYIPESLKNLDDDYITTDDWPYNSDRHRDVDADGDGKYESHTYDGDYLFVRKPMGDSWKNEVWKINIIYPGQYDQYHGIRSRNERNSSELNSS